MEMFPWSPAIDKQKTEAALEKAWVFSFLEENEPAPAVDCPGRLCFPIKLRRADGKIRSYQYSLHGSV